MVPDDDSFGTYGADDPLARRVIESIGIGGRDAVGLRSTKHGPAQRVLGGQFGDGRRLQKLSLCHAVGRMQRDDLRLAQRERARLVQDDRVDHPEQLDEDAPLDDRTLPSRAPNRPQDRKRCPGGYPACARHDDDGDRRPGIACQDEGQSGRAQREVDEVPGETVGRLLNRCPRLLSALDGLDDLGERRVTADTRRANLERPRLVDGSGEHARSRHLLDGQRFARDRGLVHERMPSLDDAIHRHAATGPDHHHLADGKGAGRNVGDLPVASYSDRSREKVEEILDGAPSSAHRHVLEHLGDKHEEDNDRRGERLADREGGDEGDGHGELHRHAPLPQRLERFLEDRVAPHHGRGQRDRVDSRNGRPREEPGHQHHHRDQPDTKEVSSMHTVLVIVVVILGSPELRRGGITASGTACRG